MQTLCFMSGLTSEQWAAWIQAVGSVVAIAASAGIAIWQSRRTVRHERQLRDEDTARRMEAIKELLVAAYGMAMDYSDALHDGRKLAGLVNFADSADFRELADEVARIDLSNVPSGPLVSRLIAARGAVRNLAKLIEALHDAEFRDGDFLPQNYDDEDDPYLPHLRVLEFARDEAIEVAKWFRVRASN